MPKKKRSSAAKLAREIQAETGQPYTACLAEAQERLSAEPTPDPYANGICPYGEDEAPGSGCIKPAGHDGAHLVTPGDTSDIDDA